jgi:hypothetical protein
VPGGNGNLAGGNNSFAAGYRAKANHQGCFVWGDATDADVSSSGERQFIVRANGGLWFGRATTAITPTIGANEFISTSTGAYLSIAGEWVSASDRNAKENLAPVDTGRLLARLSQVPVSTWNYTVQDPSIRHIGPMAQDFYAAFGVGEDDRHISTVDADGVALAAIQGLYRQVQEKDGRIAALESEAAVQREQIDDLEARLSALEAAGGQSNRTGTRLPMPWLLAGGLVIAGGVLAGWRRRSGGAR